MKYALINLVVFQVVFFYFKDYQWLLSREVFKIHPLKWDSFFLMNAFTFLCADFTFYLGHRLQHRINFLWKFHKVHHNIKSMSCDVHYRQSPVLIPFVILFNLIMCVLFNNHLLYFAFYLSLISLYQIVLHSEKIEFHPVFGKLIILPQQHRLHHHRGSEHVNYGGFLNIWDKMFKTLSFKKKTDSGYGI